MTVASNSLISVNTDDTVGDVGQLVPSEPTASGCAFAIAGRGTAVPTKRIQLFSIRHAALGFQAIYS